MIDPRDPPLPPPGIPEPPANSAEPAPLNYRDRRDDVRQRDTLLPRRPFATRIGVPAGIFYSAFVAIIILSPREWTGLTLDMQSEVIIAAFALALPAAVSLTMKKTHGFGVGILISLGVAGLLIGACFLTTR